jgi:hypothetical protein
MRYSVDPLREVQIFTSAISKKLVDSWSMASRKKPMTIFKLFPAALLILGVVLTLAWLVILILIPLHLLQVV